MTKKLQGIWKTNSRMTEGSPSLSVITLNVNELSCPIKRQRLTGWIKIHDSTLCSLQEAHLDPKTQIDWKLKDGNIDSNQTRAELAILIS